MANGFHFQAGEKRRGRQKASEWQISRQNYFSFTSCHFWRSFNFHRWLSSMLGRDKTNGIRLAVVASCHVISSIGNCHCLAKLANHFFPFSVICFNNVIIGSVLANRTMEEFQNSSSTGLCCMSRLVDGPRLVAFQLHIVRAACPYDCLIR